METIKLGSKGDVVKKTATIIKYYGGWNIWYKNR